MRRAALLVLVGCAWAHGPAPAALDGVGPVPDGPAIVRTNIGLATRSGPGTYHYVCPAQWGAEETFPPIIRFGPAIFTAFEGRAYFGDLLGCGFQGRRLEGWSGSVGAVTGNREIAHIVARGAESQVWTFTGEAVERIDFDVAIDDAALDDAGELRIVAARPQPIERALTGDPVPLALDPAPQFLEWRGGVEFLVGPIDEGVALWQRTPDGWAERARGTTAIHGPIRFAGTWLALVDGETRHGATLGTVGQARPWTCLRNIDDVPIACEDRGLSRIDGRPEDPVTVSIFAIDMIQGIQPGCPLNDAIAEACGSQWLHFGGEAGLVEFDAGVPDAGLDVGVDGTIGTARAGDGCATLDPSGSWWWALMLLLRRRR